MQQSRFSYVIQINETQLNVPVKDLISLRLSLNSHSATLNPHIDTLRARERGKAEKLFQSNRNKRVSWNVISAVFPEGGRRAQGKWKIKFHIAKGIHSPEFSNGSEWTILTSMLENANNGQRASHALKFAKQFLERDISRLHLYITCFI